jgi:hypothetical protein
MYIFFELNQLYTVSDSLLRDLDHYDVMTTKPDKKITPQNQVNKHQVKIF